MSDYDHAKAIELEDAEDEIARDLDDIALLVERETCAKCNEGLRNAWMDIIRRMRHQLAALQLYRRGDRDVD
jgi:ketosteroid isomerase-like protein